LHSKEYRIYNKRTINIEEFVHVSFDESNVISPRKDVLDDVSDFLEEIQTHERGSKRKRD